MGNVIEASRGREVEIGPAEADDMIAIFEGRPGFVLRRRWERVQYIVALYAEGEMFARVAWLIRF